jgi:hypothetical protein
MPSLRQVLGVRQDNPGTGTAVSKKYQTTVFDECACRARAGEHCNGGIGADMREGLLALAVGAGLQVMLEEVKLRHHPLGIGWDARASGLPIENACSSPSGEVDQRSSLMSMERQAASRPHELVEFELEIIDQTHRPNRGCRGK